MKSASRIFDMAFASAGILAFAPVFPVIGVLIAMDDRWPIFFRQPRVGLNRRPFSILKFRTMRNGAVTRVGHYLRRTGLDETTQFFNVLRGDMSMVGPRPLTQEDVARLGWDGDRFAVRWAVKPGITGLAQVFGGIAARHSRRLDRLYFRRRSMGLDVLLILISFGMNLFGKQRVRHAWRVWRRRMRRHGPMNARACFVNERKLSSRRRGCKTFFSAITD